MLRFGPPLLPRKKPVTARLSHGRAEHDECLVLLGDLTAVTLACDSDLSEGDRSG
jgi:hypothetical protein